MPETALSSVAVYSPRPTVRVRGQEYPKLTELIIGMEMKESEAGLASLALRLSNIASDPRAGSDFAFEDESLIELGSSISVYTGDETSPQEIFSGLITGFEAEFPEKNPPELVVLAEDGLQKARMARRSVVREDVSIADVASDIAGALSLTPTVTGFTDVIGTWVQLNESDLAFLRRLLRRYDGDVQVVGDELHVSPRGDVNRGTVELEFQSQLREARFVADLSQQVTEVTVSGWDPIQGSRVSASSQGAHLAPGTGRRGAEILSSSIGARSEHLGHLAAVRDAEAQALADAAHDRIARRFVTVEGTAEGNASLRVGTHVRLTNVGPRFDNTYYVVSACHRFDVEGGYETDFQAESAWLA